MGENSAFVNSVIDMAIEAVRGLPSILSNVNRKERRDYWGAG